jgi:hypothetical protein
MGWARAINKLAATVAQDRPRHAVESGHDHDHVVTRRSGMATLHKDLKSAKLRKYFDNEFPKINTNTKVWDAFLKWSGHQEGGKPSADAARKAALQVIAKGAKQQVNTLDTIVADPKNTANTDRSANGIF